MGRTASVIFLSRSDQKQLSPQDLTLFYVVQGSSEVTTKERSFSLHHEDILAINPGEQYTLSIASGVIARITFHHEEVYSLLQGEMRLVNCYSDHVRDGSINALRFQVQTLLDSLLQEDLGGIAFEKNSCGLLLTLLNEYSVVAEKTDRKQAVEHWMENVSRENVTLEDAASCFHLTPQYFSRWFASAFDCTFLKYLTRIRCRKAELDLLNSDASILRIAMDQGFPNAASFSRAFFQQYGEAPLQYRKTHFVPAKNDVLEPKDVAPYLKKEQELLVKQARITLVDCSKLHQHLNPYWSQLLCLDTLGKLADLEVQAQVQELQKHLSFRYARVSLRKGRYSGFFPEDKGMSFLYEQGLTPVFVVSSGDAAKSEYISWLKELFQHMIYCFGIRLFHVEALWESAIHQRAEALEYREFVHSLRNLFQSMKADCDLYGPGVQLTGDGSNLETCLQANPELDHITIRCAPAGVVSRNIKPARTIPEPDYLIHQCRLAQEIVRKNKPESDLLITGWRTSLGNANVLNDSSWFGARIVQTALSGYGVLPSLPLECPLELFGNNSDLGFFLRGREGLMTLNRLPKPSFHALHFLKHLDEYHLYHDRHMIVSASADGFIQIVIQNSSPLSHQYYFYDEETISKPVPIPHTFYESLEPYEVCLRLTGVSNGQWMMKTRIVNDSVGSVFQAWLTLNYQNDSFIGKDETELMRAKALPDIRGNTVTSSKGVLEVPLNMGPNEIRHIHLIPIR